MTLDPEIAARLKRDEHGLFPAVAQQYDTGEVLMLAWMDDVALHRTLTTGRCTYWSRSRNEYWVKGETSGHQQWVKSVAVDCDGDAVLVQVDQVGPACHTGDRTCFDAGVLDGDGRRAHDRRVTVMPRSAPDAAHAGQVGASPGDAAPARRERTLMLTVGAAGAGIVLLAAEQAWARASFTPPSPLPAASVTMTGHELAPAAAALGLAALACLAAVLATGGVARRLCGALLTALGALAAADAVASVGRGHLAAIAATHSLASAGPPLVALTPFPWWAAAAVGGLLLAAAGTLTAWRGTRWPGMSSRYDRPGGPTPVAGEGQGTAWDALDRGADPTATGR